MKKLITQTIFLLVALLVGTTATYAISKDDISLKLDGISTSLSGFSNINEYIDGSDKSFTITGKNLYVKGRLYNETYQNIVLNTSRILVAYIAGDSPYTSTTYSPGGSELSSITIGSKSSTEVIIKIPENFQIRNGKLNLYFVYAEGSGGYFSTGTYNVTRGNTANIQNIQARNSGLSKAQNAYFQPIEVSRNYNGPYEDIMQYRPYTGKYYYMGSDNLNVKFSIKNKTNEPITFNSNSFKINYGTQNLYNIHGVANESNTAITSFTVPANETINVIFHLGNEWYDNRENPNNPGYYQPVRLFLYYDGIKTDGISYSYLFTRTNEKSLSITPSVVTSDVTIKSTDNTAIKSIRVIGTMGDLVKSQSCGNNCTETNINLSNCKNGIYYIQVEKTNGVETAKIIKK